MLIALSLLSDKYLFNSRRKRWALMGGEMGAYSVLCGGNQKIA